MPPNDVSARHLASNHSGSGLTFYITDATGKCANERPRIESQQIWTYILCCGHHHVSASNLALYRIEPDLPTTLWITPKGVSASDLASNRNASTLTTYVMDVIERRISQRHHIELPKIGTYALRCGCRRKLYQPAALHRTITYTDLPPVLLMPQKMNQLGTSHSITTDPNIPTK
jgi:hypothetical protein